MKQVPIHLPVFFPSSSTVVWLFSSIGEHVTLNQNKRQNNRGSHICLPYSVSKYLTRPQKKLSERHKGNNKHEKNNRIFEKEKNISANRDGHFYDGYPGKNTFRKAVVLHFSISWGCRDHRSSERMPPSPPLNTETSTSTDGPRELVGGNRHRNTVSLNWWTQPQNSKWRVDSLIIW